MVPHWWLNVDSFKEVCVPGPGVLDASEAILAASVNLDPLRFLFESVRL